MGVDVEEATARSVLFVVFVDVGVGNPVSRRICCGGDGEDGAAFDLSHPAGSSGTKATATARLVAVVVVAAPPECGRTRLGNNTVVLDRGRLVVIISRHAWVEDRRTRVVISSSRTAGITVSLLCLMNLSTPYILLTVLLYCFSDFDR